MNKNQKLWTLILVFAIIDLLIHFLTNAKMGLHRDEYLYVAMKDHLDFGYLSIPPFTAFIGKLSNLFFGHSVFAYRILPSLAGAFTVILAGLIVKELKGSYLAITIACLSYILSPTFLHINFLFQPVTFDIFFWTLISYLVILMIQRDNPKIWIYLGLTVAIAILNKYSIAFLIIGIIIALLLSPHRKLLASKYFFIALFIGFLIVLPNLIWQYKHNFPVVNHMAELRNNQLINISATNFIIDQFIMNVHALPIWLTGIIVLLFLKKERRFQFISVFYITVFVFLILAKGKSYYTAGLYPLLFAAGGYAMDKYLTGKLRFINYYFIITLPLSGIITVPYGIPIFNYKKLDKFYQATAKFINYAPLRWEDGKIHKMQQDWADMTGWKELSDIVIKTYNSLKPDERKKCQIYTENHGEAGAIRFYGKKVGLPEPISFSDNFLLWAPDSTDITYTIYVHSDTSDIYKLYKRVDAIDSISDIYAREHGLRVFLCSEPTSKAASYYINVVKKIKSNFKR